jgi:hypothetical protein
MQSFIRPLYPGEEGNQLLGEAIIINQSTRYKTPKTLIFIITAVRT